jgi:hypothetical protein
MLHYYLHVASVNSFFPPLTHYVNHRDLNEDRRARLREIELKAVQYQDELECGQRTLKSGWSIQQQVEHYRRKLLRKVWCRNLTLPFEQHEHSFSSVMDYGCSFMCHTTITAGARVAQSV